MDEFMAWQIDRISLCYVKLFPPSGLLQNNDASISVGTKIIKPVLDGSNGYCPIMLPTGMGWIDGFYSGCLPAFLSFVSNLVLGHLDFPMRRPMKWVSWTPLNHETDSELAMELHTARVADSFSQNRTRGATNVFVSSYGCAFSFSRV